MLDFRSLTPQDRELVHNNLYRAIGHGSEYSFANLFMWGDQKVAFFEGAPVFFSRFGIWQSYLLPQDTNLRAAINALREDAHERNIPFRIFGLTAREVEQMSFLFPEEFRFRPQRNSFDYVYDIDRLAELKGKKLQAKRNHCNRFEANFPDYEILPLTEDRLPLCRELTEKWYISHEESSPEIDYAGEKAAISKAFDNFSALHMEGIVLQTREGVVAFSMGNRIREDTFDVNFEKAIGEIQGAYPMVNREFARRIREKHPEIRFLDREDDMGLEGLRKAKESYYPDILLEKYVGEEVG